MFRFASAVLLAACSFGCGTESIAGPSSDVVIEPIEIQSVEVVVGTTPPALAIARVIGGIGSGCDFLHSIEQRRDGNVVTVDIKRARITGVPCTAIFKEFRQEIALGGELPSGQYTVRVNGTSRSFSVP